MDSEGKKGTIVPDPSRRSPSIHWWERKLKNKNKVRTIVSPKIFILTHLPQEPRMPAWLRPQRPSGRENIWHCKNKTIIIF